MPKQKVLSFLLITVSVFFYSHGQTESKLKIDPALFIYVKECRNIMRAIGSKIWEDWDFSQTPILFYRPLIQDVLINYPHKPKGFEILTGFNPLGEEKIYYRDGETFIPYDGQNTSKEIDGIRTLVVADTYSNQRDQIRGVVLGRDKDFVQKWLDEWNFVPNNPYSQIRLILHEAFHVFQRKNAPQKNANELIAIDYPLLDNFNNSYWSLEAAIMNDALLSKDKASKVQKIKELIAIRDCRRAKLKKESIEYEDLIEYKEGTAKYIEFAFLKKAQGLVPSKQLFYINGFHGYGEVLGGILEKELKRIKDIIAVNIDMTGNKFGVGPLRFRLYSSGATLALLLDEVDSDWKKDIFKDEVYLYDKVKDAVKLDENERFQLIVKTKNEYNYERIKREKKHFEKEGREVLTEKLKNILETKDNLVSINFSEIGNQLELSFTPFGVTKIGEDSAIYDMIPLMGQFENKAKFKFYKVIPVIVDKGRKELKFAVKTDISEFKVKAGNEIKVDEFALTGSKFEITTNKNKIYIKLLK